ncbi:hypothetical protein CDAR_51201 [Caerostris darwini]|uniref:Transmembrane protein n=1 Tax=Caerostris darwini TaxID=1538125 RepID=A0AAV4U613_9ARAC|nr:hypothetical protein CDAR_51201 [Caerostris darwini]
MAKSLNTSSFVLETLMIAAKCPEQKHPASHANPRKKKRDLPRNHACKSIFPLCHGRTHNHNELIALPRRSSLGSNQLCSQLYPISVSVHSYYFFFFFFSLPFFVAFIVRIQLQHSSGTCSILSLLFLLLFSVLVL